MILYDKLKETYSYNPITGNFIRIKSTKNRKVGDIAGCFDNSTGYIRIGLRIDGKDKLYHAHRLAWLFMTKELPNQVDHVNGVRHDNRFCNLRDVSNKENHLNMKLRTDNTTGFTGVTLCNKTGKFIAQIMIEQKNIYLGSYSDFTKAIKAREKANIQYGFHSNHGKR